MWSICWLQHYHHHHHHFWFTSVKVLSTTWSQQSPVCRMDGAGDEPLRDGWGWGEFLSAAIVLSRLTGTAWSSSIDSDWLIGAGYTTRSTWWGWWMVTVLTRPRWWPWKSWRRCCGEPRSRYRDEHEMSLSLSTPDACLMYVHTHVFGGWVCDRLKNRLEEHRVEHIPPPRPNSPFNYY